MGRTMDKAKLLAAIEREHKRLDETLALVGEAQMLEPNFEGGWSVKDLLSHITFWDNRALAGIMAALTGEPPEHREGTINEVNAQAAAENHEKTLAEVLAEYRNAYEFMIKKLQLLSEEDLTDPKRFAWAKGTPLRRWIRQDTDRHYAVHNRQIRAWIGNRG